MFRIVVATVLILLSLLVFYATTLSLKKLKREVFPFYPFDSFFPQESAWSVGYFLIVILFLGLLIFFLTKGEFYLGPA